MKKIAFITSGYFPVPSVKGGAVETLIDSLIENNDINEKYKIDVYSIFDREAYNKSKYNKNVKYIFLKKDKVYGTFQKYYRYIINHLTNCYIGNDYIHDIIKKYKSNMEEYDYVIVENKPEYALILKKYVKGKLILHMHNDFLNKNTKHAKDIFESYYKIFAISRIYKK